MDEDYLQMQRHMKNTLEKASEIIRYYDRGKGTEAKTINIRRGCRIYDGINQIMDEMPKQEILNRMLYFHEIDSIIQAILLSQALITEEDVQPEAEHMMSCYDNREWISSLAKIFREHWEGRKAELNQETKGGAKKSSDDSRDAVLKKQNAESLAVKYNDLIKMDGKGSAYVKGYKIVYIYHDKIDETGHVNEDLVCTACEDAIEEIKNMVKVIVNYYGGTRILITADHGFLYTAKPLSEDSKVDKTTAKAEDVEVDRRYLITKRGASPEYLLPVKFLDGNTEYDAFAPRESIRIKKKGGGLNYVHGGISLQEMVVPVIDYHYLRNQNKKYQRSRDQYDTKPVTISLLSASRKISNMIFSLNFYQKEAVGDNREPANYLLYFVDSENRQISDTQKIIADKTNENNQERTFRCSFNLKSMKFNEKETYYLVIIDEAGLQMPQREEFQIDIAFAVDDFDFF